MIKNAIGGRDAHGSNYNIIKIMLVMKLTVFLLTAVFLNVSAKVVSQNITLSGKDLTLKAVFNEVEKQTGYFFLYPQKVLEKASPITIDAKNLPLTEFLHLLFKNQPLSYIVIGNKTINVSSYPAISPKSRVFTDDSNNSENSSSYNVFSIRGKVLDSVGRPLPGATIIIKNSKVSGITDAEGMFSVNVNEGDVLLVSYVGYETRSVIITLSMLSSSNNLVITLKPSIAKLDDVEVVVNTGYQEIPKERVTGSFVKIDNELLNRSISTNILDRITTVTSGLTYNPGLLRGSKQSNITIRGISTINANMRPLVVVDGFPYDESSDYSNVINNINPSDVASITILKDAAAASIWGVRAGNGVIVIVTKQGRLNRKLSVQLNSNVTIGSKPDLFYPKIVGPKNWIETEKMLFQNGVYQTAEDYSNLYNYPSIVIPQVAEILIAQRDNQITAAEADARIAVLANHDVRNDINKYFLQKSINQQYALNISGGSDKTAYYGSIGYDNNRLTNVGDQYERLTLFFKNTYTPVKNLSIQTYLNYAQSESKNNGIGLRYFPLQNNPIAPYTMLADVSGNPLAIPYSFRSTFVDTVNYPGLLDWHLRPLDELRNSNNTSAEFAARFGASVSYKIIDGLSAELKYQYEKGINTTTDLQNEQTYDTRNLINSFVYVDANTGETIYPVPSGAILDERVVNRNAWNIRGQLNFNKRWQTHELNILAGSESRQVKNEYRVIREYGYNTEVTLVNKVDYNIDYTTRPLAYILKIPFLNDIGSNLNRYISYFANGAYTYLNKYTISASGRIDGSNFFGVEANKRQVPLWSVGLAWDISKENFYKNDWLPYLRLRTTYGYNGNTNNNATTFTTIKYENGVNSFGAIGAYIFSPPNPQLRWEKVRMINLGIDFNTKSDRIFGSLEYYTKRGIDLIGPIAVDATTGVASYTGNKANIKGEGVDVLLNANIINSQIKWKTNFLFSYSADKVTAYEDVPKTGLNYIGNPVVIGKPLFSVFSYKWAGLDPATGDPRIYLGDTVSRYSNFSKASENDLVYNGPATPKYFGSVINTFSYKNLSLSFNITYKFGYFFRRGSVKYANALNATSFSIHSDYLNRWVKAGDENATNVPSLPSSPEDNRDFVYLSSDVLVEKGDHIRLQDIRLSYDLQNFGQRKLPFQKASVYIYANNLGILWRANGKNIDPDFGDGSNGLFPNPQAIAVGFTLNF